MSWWNQVTKDEKFYDTWAPRLPSLQEIKETLEQTVQEDDIIQFKREVLSVRAVQSSVQIGDDWYPRNLTCLLTLKWPVADDPQALLRTLEELALGRVFNFFFSKFESLIFFFSNSKV